MRLILLFVCCVFLTIQLQAQDNCSNARALCANSAITATTQGATSSPTDPALTCGDNTVNNSIWFTVSSFAAGTATVSVAGIDSANGLAMQVYTGTCGSLVTTGICTSATGVQGSMSVSFATSAGSVYYIMVDGNSGTQENFSIQAASSNNSITARPDANFLANPVNGCVPLNVLLDNTTILLGGTNITYQWKIDGGSYIPSSGADTNITFATTGTHTIELRVCNTECGCKSVIQDVIGQDLTTSINYTPPNACLGSTITFTGSAAVVPDPPYVNPNVTSWQWNFGDPASGSNNTGSGMIVTHEFVGPATSFTVQLIANGSCGPDTSFTTINLNPKIYVNLGPDQILCEGDPIQLNAVDSNATQPIISYSFSGPGSFSCGNCANPSITGLLPGGPYPFSVTITDNNGCTADTIVDVTIRPKPVVNAGNDTTVCRYSPVPIDASVTTGIPPFTYSWSPAAGLNSSTIEDPNAFVTSSSNYCVTVADSIGCTSDPDCVALNVFTPPTISSNPATLCATDPNLSSVYTVSGAGVGSTYHWYLSSNYSLITSSNSDSSQVTVTYPPNVVAAYSFTCIVMNITTGCTDTLNASFNITPGLNMTLTGQPSICEGQSATLNVLGATTYGWSASPAYAFSDTTLASQSVSPIVTTVFTVTGRSGNCTQTLTYTVTVNPLPDAVAAPIPDFCGCDTLTLNGAGSTPGMNYVWSSSISTIASSSALNTTAISCGSDNFTLTVTDPVTNCSANVSVPANSAPKPAAVANVTPPLICNGVNTPINLDGTGSDTNAGTFYNWSSNNGAAIITDTTSLVTTSNVSTATVFSLTVTDILGCDTTVYDTVNIYPLPVMTAVNPFICTSDPVLTSVVSVSGAGAGSTYVWDTIPSCAIPNAANTSSEVFDFTTCGAGFYSFYITVTDGVNGCINQVNSSVTVVNGVVLTSSADQTICEGESATISSSGANNYQWSSGASDTLSAVTLNNLTAAASPHTFYVTGTIGTCTTVDTVVIYVNPTPSPVFINGPTSVCENDTSSAYSIIPVGGSNYTWVATGGIITSGQNTAAITIDWDSAGVGFVEVFDTNSFNCPGPPSNLTVTINPNPDSLFITGPDTVCENDVATYLVNPTAGSTYLWNVNGGIALNGLNNPNIDVQWGVSGTGTLSMFEVNSVGCLGPLNTYNVIIHPIPVAIPISGDSVVCENDTMLVYSVPETPGSVYVWSVAQGTIANGQGSDSIYVNWGSSGIGSVNVTEINLYSCTGPINTMNVQLDATPILAVTPDSTTLCSNVNLSIIGSLTTGTVNWYSTGSGTFSDTLNVSPIYTPSLADTIGITLYAIASNGACPNDTENIILNIQPAPQAQASASISSICFGDSVFIAASGGTNYFWTNNGSIAQSYTDYPTSSTTYQVIVFSSFGCADTAAVSVNVIPPGIPDAGADAAICFGDTVQLNGSFVNANSILWSTTGDGFFSPTNTDPNALYYPGVNDTVSGNVQINIVTSGACLNLSDSLFLQLSAVPLVYAGLDTTLETGGIAQLSGNIFNANNAIWTSSGTGTFTPSDTSLNATYTPSQADYLLDSIIITLTTMDGCRVVYDYLKIEFTDFFIPNVFTPYPNSEGVNDFFEIRRLPAESKLKIWDRWGLLVFVSDNYRNDWDAAQLNADMYYYILLLKDGRDFHGWVKVLR